MQNHDAIPETIKTLRKEAGLSQIQLAEMADVSRTAIQNIESGKLTIQLDTLLKIFHVLNIKMHLISPLPGVKA